MVPSHIRLNKWVEALNLLVESESWKLKFSVCEDGGSFEKIKDDGNKLPLFPCGIVQSKKRFPHSNSLV